MAKCIPATLNLEGTIDLVPISLVPIGCGAASAMLSSNQQQRPSAAVPGPSHM